MHPGWLRCSSVTYKRVCAFVAPRQPGASTANIDRLSHSQALSHRALDLLASNVVLASSVGGLSIRELLFQQEDLARSARA
jgi:hypothetical protein